MGISSMQIISRIPGDSPNITRRTVRDQISDKLAYMIHSGLLRPGDELPSERELATTLGVSRETVRAAISMLQAWRMLEVSQGARTRVLGPGSVGVHDSVSILRDLGERSVEEVAEARAAVELQVIRLAARRITPAQLNRLDDLLADQAAMMDDPVRFQISDQEFHEVLYRACGNALLADVVFDFYGYALEHRRNALRRPGAISHSVADHRAIVAALKSSDPEAAVAAMQQHLEQVHRTTLQEMDAP
ncbi:Putative L-lactate dehydrogenase operon regulatory protein [Pigmentiphaga humi]|uniref:L-lactate dehydrogenase operon regulatory protein n=2 Tax=Pigmentiphaga humi TaxID=2478468 RepID=A0A3P4AZI0_9BURK|nr:Putative L-lactate dehydrogenase operon regulatory protein [Pigmentiphaga humi]